MEATAQSVEDYLIDGLSFKLRPGASYITNRRSVSYFPQGGNQYSPNGVKVIRIMLTGDSWVDPSTIRVMFNLVNGGTSGQYLYPVSGPWCFFRRLRVLCGGQLLEDIDYYNKVHEMFHYFQSVNNRANDNTEGFLANEYNLNTSYTTSSAGCAIAGAGGFMTVAFRPLSGLINQDKFLPIRYAPITLEFEIVNNYTDCIIVPGISDFTSTNTSSAWEIQQFQIKCDVCTLDNALDNEYAQHLLSGKSLPINFSTYVTQLQAITSNSSVSINVQRAFTRLKSAFVSLVNSSALSNGVRKEFNFFYNPGFYAGSAYDSSKDVQFQLQIGSKLYPEYPIWSTQEAFYQLRKCLGVQATSFHSIDISAIEYKSTKYIVGIDTEKVLAAGFTGLNTKAGDLMTVKFNRMPTDNTAPDKMYIILHADVVMNIRDTGVEIFE
jgi:hypothetical protein